MQERLIPINPAMLQWARMEAGLSLEEAAGRAKIPPPRKRKDEPEATPEQRLAAWENGRSTPSWSQLEKMASVYRRPPATFFLLQPPVKIAPLADFRTIANPSAIADTPEFAALKRRIVIVHRELLSLAKEEGQPSLPFVGSMGLHDSIESIVASIRNALQLTFQRQTQIRTEDDLLGHLREQAHQAGIFVLLEGDLGSYHSKISPEEFRGIAIADSVVPLIVINPNDAKPARVFILVHELAHIWLGASGISNLNALSSHSASGQEEQLCNAVAAELLAPASQVHAMWNPPDKEEGEELHVYVDRLAKNFKVSGAVAGRRLADLEYISNSEYGSLLAYYQRRWETRKEKQSQRGDGPSRNVLDGFRLGKKTVRTFVAAAYNGKISLQDAARILNIPVSRFDRVMQ
jgi:Zn-dependent peptidase ImmA (M78 family)/transcriptional regulator with XRE-family HTH domain